LEKGTKGVTELSKKMGEKKGRKDGKTKGLTIYPVPVNSFWFQTA